MLRQLFTSNIFKFNNTYKYSSVNTTSNTTIDIMDGKQLHKDIDDHGFIKLVDVMPRLVPIDTTADHRIADAARVSYGNKTKKTNDDKTLIRRLMRDKHTSPFEMVEFTFLCSLPIFVARQWIRHRTANLNEISARYSVVEDKFYEPPNLFYQSSNNKQGSGEVIMDPKLLHDFNNYVNMSIGTYDVYEYLISKGVSREQARISLPVNMYTKWYWKCDLHNIFNFLRLRMHKDAQLEIRNYANAMYDLIYPIVPISCEAFKDYQLESMVLSRLEIDAIKNNKEIDTNNSREKLEFEEKKSKLFR